MAKIRITQVKSAIDRPERQKLTLQALGLNRINASKEVEATAQILGMVRAVNHLIKVENSTSDNRQPETNNLQELQPLPGSADRTETQIPAEVQDSLDEQPPAPATDTNKE